MSAQERSANSRSVPVLTEVVLLSEPEAVDIPIDALPVVTELAVSDPPSAPVATPTPVALPENVEDQLVERVWADLQRQVDLMLEYRLRETLAPILSRATEAVLRDTRQQLASTLRDVVARAVAQELSRHRGR